MPKYMKNVSYYLLDKITEEESQSEEDEHLCEIDEEEDEHRNQVWPQKDGNHGKVRLHEDKLLAKFQQDENQRRAKDQLEEDEQPARTIQESLNIGSPPRHGNDSLFKPSPISFPLGFR